MGVRFMSIDSKAALGRKKRLKEWIAAAIENEMLEFSDIVIAFCSDSYIVAENVRFLSHNYPTDIITFDYCQGEIVTGDLLISTDTVKRNARQYGVTFEREMQRVIIHGVLHLCGYGDKSEKEQLVMSAREDYYLQKLDEI